MQTSKLKIVVACANFPDVYSGGRYHATSTAIALALAGNEVVLWTNLIPPFIKDFEEDIAASRLELFVDEKFSGTPDIDADVVIVAPHMGRFQELFSRATRFAQDSSALLAMINFETPNWYNQIAPEPRDPELWSSYVELANSSHLVLSISGQSNEYARDYYSSKGSNAKFDYVYPAINTTVADAVEAPEKQQQIVCITRISMRHAHKGASELETAIHSIPSGYTLALITGNPNIDKELLERIEASAREAGVKLRFLMQLSDAEKFRVIKESRLMLFLSRFEGYGYPPVEAQYCGTPCVAYDLPVLREVSKDMISYVECQDAVALKAAINSALTGNHAPSEQLRSNVAEFSMPRNVGELLSAKLLTYLAEHEPDSKPLLARLKNLFKRQRPA